MNSKYQIRLARQNELALLNEIEMVAGRLFANTKYALLDDLEPLPLALLQQQHDNKCLWVATNEQDTPVG